MMRSGLPIAARIGLTSANALASPPTMIESVALIAPISPPLTGASSMVAALVRAASASRRATTGAMLLMSMRMVPGWMALKIPFVPSTTWATSAESGSIVMIRVARRATSSGDVARAAPVATSSSTGPGLRLCTTSGKPRLMRLAAMGLPMRPRPMNPTVSNMLIFSTHDHPHVIPPDVPACGWPAVRRRFPGPVCAGRPARGVPGQLARRHAYSDWRRADRDDQARRPAHDVLRAPRQRRRPVRPGRQDRRRRGRQAGVAQVESGAGRARRLADPVHDRHALALRSCRQQRQFPRRRRGRDRAREYGEAAQGAPRSARDALRSRAVGGAADADLWRGPDAQRQG